MSMIRDDNYVLNSSQRDGKSNKSKYVIAKRVPEDHFGKEPNFDSPVLTAIPLSLVKSTNLNGPKKAKKGKYLDHTILGDLEDFEQFERMFSAKDEPVILLTETDPTKNLLEVDNSEQDTSRVTFAGETKDTVKDDSQNTESSEKARWLKKLHIFQRYRELREENALRNWKRHSIEWDKVEQTISKKLNKEREDLVMGRLNEFRRHIEEQDFIEEALALLEERHVNFWKTGLSIGNDLLGLTVQMPKGGPRQIERLRMNVNNTKGKKSKSDYREAKKKDLQHVISAIDPFFFHGDSGYLEVQGHSISKNELAEEFLERMERRLSSIGLFPNNQTISNESNAKAESDLSNTTLDEVSTSALTIYNQGTVAIHFEWLPLQKPNPLGISACNDGIQRFFLTHTRGTIMPGAAYDFPITFKSSSPGIFTHLIQLATSPEMPKESNLVVTLQGMAVEIDIYQEKRLKLVKSLETQRAYTVAKDILEQILNNVYAYSGKSKLAQSDIQDAFIAKNAELNLRFIPPVVEKMKEIANDVKNLLSVSRPWDYSVMSLHESIMKIQKPDIRANFIFKLNNLVKECTTAHDVSIPAMRYIICYDILVEIATKMAESSYDIRKRMNLPMNRSAAKFDPDEVIHEEDAQIDSAKKTALGKAGEANDTKKANNAPPNQPATQAKDAKKANPAPVPAPPANAKATVPSDPKRPPNKKETEGEDVPSTVGRKKTDRPLSPALYSATRRVQEKEYYSDFKTSVRDIIDTSLSKLVGLYDDLSPV